MSSKKESKIVPFNKANALALADMIFCDRNGVVSFLKLCDQTLSNGKDGGRTLHCAVGEAYHYFVNPDMRKILKTESYEAKYQVELDCDDKTARAIDELVDVAFLKNPKDKVKLAKALADAVDINDSTTGENADEYLTRSQDVSDVFRHQIAPLLK